MALTSFCEKTTPWKSGMTFWVAARCVRSNQQPQIRLLCRVNEGTLRPLSVLLAPPTSQGSKLSSEKWRVHTSAHSLTLPYWETHQKGNYSKCFRTSVPAWLISAPSSMRTFTASMCPHLAARCNGVCVWTEEEEEQKDKWQYPLSGKKRSERQKYDKLLRVSNLPLVRTWEFSSRGKWGSNTKSFLPAVVQRIID